MYSVRRKNLVEGTTVAALCFCAVFVLAANLQAEVTSGSVRLSTHSSNGEVTPPDPMYLDALFTFTVDDGIDQLTLTVDNLTPEDPCSDPWFNMSQVFFNVKSNITNLDLTAVIGSDILAWDWGNGPQGSTFELDGHHVDGFGLFDVALRDGTGGDEDVINFGETVEFVFTITASGPYSASDFITLSSQIDTHILSYGAAKFYNGDPAFTGFGATEVPEPTTICLFGLGALALLRKRRK